MRRRQQNPHARDISNACASIGRLAVLRAVRRHAKQLAPPCASQLVKGGTQAVIKARENQSERQEHEYKVSVGVWQESTLSNATYRLTPWSRMADMMIEINRDKPAAVFISYADPFIISTKHADANATWEKTVAALRKIGVKIDVAKSLYSKEQNGITMLSSTRRTWSFWAQRRRRGTR